MKAQQFFIHFIFQLFLGSIFYFWVIWINNTISSLYLTYLLFVAGFSIIAIVPNLLLGKDKINAKRIFQPQSLALMGFPVAIVLLLLIK